MPNLHDYFDLKFNTAESKVMHLDLNSCFASIEQQANPFLRYKPLAVAAYDSPGGCILAPSIEAKTFGIKTGMRVKDATKLYPNLLVLTPDPDKYRHVHLKFRNILKDYSTSVVPKSIDEFVLNFDGMPALEVGLSNIALEIKQRIKDEIGSWMRVSVGISTNRFLAKTAAGLKKPDGLEEINHKNYLDVYSKLKLTDLTGIARKNDRRLKQVGITNVTEFWSAPLWKLKLAFNSINSYYWYVRLRGHEIDDFDITRRSFGNSFALPFSKGTKDELLPILQKLCEKTGVRMRAQGYVANGIHVSLAFKDRNYWHHGEVTTRSIFDSKDIYKEAVRILDTCPLFKLGQKTKPVHVLAVTCFNLTQEKTLQYELFTNMDKKKTLVETLDTINDRFGDFVITPARMNLTGDMIKDRIGFGNVREI